MGKQTPSAASQGDDAATPSVGEQVQEVTGQVQEAAGQVQETAGQLVNQVREQATTQLTSQKDRAAQGLKVVSQALRLTSEQVRMQDQAMVAQYLDGAADRVERVSDQIRTQDLGQLFQATEQFARRRPELFVGAALATGFLASRFLRSSPQQEGSETQPRTGSVDTAVRPVYDYDADLYTADYAGTRTGVDDSAGYGTVTGFDQSSSLSEAMAEARATGTPLTAADYRPDTEGL
jgi:ElaB/YqjD/DUF883 family membrane-anchored ribosome-binding protein